MNTYFQKVGMQRVTARGVHPVKIAVKAVEPQKLISWIMIKHNIQIRKDRSSALLGQKFKCFENFDGK